MHKAGANHPFFGKHHSEESRQKISESLKGRPSHKKGKRIPEEVKHKISESLKGKPGWLKGKHHSAETRLKMSEAICGMLWWNNGISNKRSRECPGEGWRRGKLMLSIS